MHRVHREGEVVDASWTDEHDVTHACRGHRSASGHWNYGTVCPARGTEFNFDIDRPAMTITCIACIGELSQ